MKNALNAAGGGIVSSEALFSSDYGGGMRRGVSLDRCCWIAGIKEIRQTLVRRERGAALLFGVQGAEGAHLYILKSGGAE